MWHRLLYSCQGVDRFVEGEYRRNQTTLLDYHRSISPACPHYTTWEFPLTFYCWALLPFYSDRPCWLSSKDYAIVIKPAYKEGYFRVIWDIFGRSTHSLFSSNSGWLQYSVVKWWFHGRKAAACSLHERYASIKQRKPISLEYCKCHPQTKM